MDIFMLILTQCFPKSGNFDNKNHKKSQNKNLSFLSECQHFFESTSRQNLNMISCAHCAGIYFVKYFSKMQIRKEINMALYLENYENLGRIDSMEELAIWQEIVQQITVFEYRHEHYLIPDKWLNNDSLRHIFDFMHISPYDFKRKPWQAMEPNDYIRSLLIVYDDGSEYLTHIRCPLHRISLEDIVEGAGLTAQAESKDNHSSQNADTNDNESFSCRYRNSIPKTEEDEPEPEQMWGLDCLYQCGIEVLFETKLEAKHLEKFLMESIWMHKRNNLVCLMRAKCDDLTHHLHTRQKTIESYAKDGYTIANPLNYTEKGYVQDIILGDCERKVQMPLKDFLCKFKTFCDPSVGRERDIDLFTPGKTVWDWDEDDLW